MRCRERGGAEGGRKWVSEKKQMRKRQGKGGAAHATVGSGGRAQYRARVALEGTIVKIHAVVVRTAPQHPPTHRHNLSPAGISLSLASTTPTACRE